MRKGEVPTLTRIRGKKKKVACRHIRHGHARKEVRTESKQYCAAAAHHSKEQDWRETRRRDQEAIAVSLCVREETKKKNVTLRKLVKGTNVRVLR